MTKDQVASEASAVENPAEGVDPALAAILKAVTDLGQRVSDMEVRSPRTVTTRAERSWSNPKNASEAMAAMMEGETESLGSRTVPIMVNGQEIRGDLFSLMKPRYKPGDRVALRRDYPMDDGSGPRGDYLDKLNVEGVGEIKRVYWLGRRLIWKYRVRFPGLTSSTGNGYYEDELEYA